MKRFVFGPVPSRRLGFSLGVDLIPRKYCSFDCIYCQLGPTAQTHRERQSFYDPALVVEQVVERVREGGRIDCVSLSGSGEPTLNSDIGWVIRTLKDRISLPVAVITNGSLLSREDVRKDLMRADIVLPSLDAASETVYRQVNRPHESLGFASVVEGLDAFCREYRGRVWLEVMLIDNVNNDAQHIEMFKTILDGLPVEKIQLNTVARPPAERTARPVSRAGLLSVARFFGSRTEVIADRVRKQESGFHPQEWEHSVLAMLARRSLGLADIARSTGVSGQTAREGMKRLVEQKKARVVALGRRRFYLVAEQDE